MGPYMGDVSLHTGVTEVMAGFVTELLDYEEFCGLDAAEPATIGA